MIIQSIKPQFYQRKVQDNKISNISKISQESSQSIASRNCHSYSTLYFTGKKQLPESELNEILNEKIKQTGKITPDMIDENMSKLLLKAAQSATEKSYAPYSNFHVGAAIISENGKIYKGCNVENASYGLTLCAERNALSSMVVDSGYQQIAALGIIGKEADGECYPCGACRQWIEEFDKKENAKIVLLDHSGEPVSTTIKELLPNAFGPKDLDSAN